MALAGLAVAVALTNLSVPDIFACILAFVPTGWGIISVSFSSWFLFGLVFYRPMRLIECEEI